MLTKEEIIQICRDSLKVENLTNSGTDRDTYSFKLYFETVADKISSRLDALVSPKTAENIISFKTRAIDKLLKFYDYGGTLGYSNQELSRIQSCITKIREIEE